jgi:hypothetical protein
VETRTTTLLKTNQLCVELAGLNAQLNAHTKSKLSRTTRFLNVGRACLIALTVLGTLLAINTFWSGPVQDHIAERVAQQ